MPPPEDLLTAPIEIAKDIFWVGKRDPTNVFHSNPYLRRYRSEDEKGRRTEFNLLIDPGSSTDFAVVQTKVASVLGGTERISALWINHQDPDVGSIAPMLVSRFAPNAQILCSEDTWRLIVHTNLPRSKFLATERFSKGIKTPTGHLAIPVPTPFCHFRGAVGLYDVESRILFSGDLLGGLTEANAKGLWADESDWSGIRAFHQLYMPCNTALAKAVARIRSLTPKVEVIAPQHGRLLRGAVMETFLDRLARLPVGLDVIEEQEDPSLLNGWSSVLDRVVRTAASYLGNVATTRLMADGELADAIDFSASPIRVKSLGRWCVERSVLLLTQGEPFDIANPIKMEAIHASLEYGLPTPSVPMEIEEGTGTIGG